MRLGSDGSTNPNLLRSVANWGDYLDWVRFWDTYNPMLERWCRGYGLDGDAIDDVCQCIWIELASRMKTFEYNPTRTFRGWLRRLCESRVLNFLRQRKAALLLSLDLDARISEPESIPTAPPSTPLETGMVATCRTPSCSAKPRRSRPW
jgi:RNA polymerase sigma-70 factor (ECF subfamily)